MSLRNHRYNMIMSHLPCDEYDYQMNDINNHNNNIEYQAPYNKMNTTEHEMTSIINNNINNKKGINFIDTTMSIQGKYHDNYHQEIKEVLSPLSSECMKWVIHSLAENDNEREVDEMNKDEFVQQQQSFMPPHPVHLLINKHATSTNSSSNSTSSSSSSSGSSNILMRGNASVTDDDDDQEEIDFNDKTASDLPSSENLVLRLTKRKRGSDWRVEEDAMLVDLNAKYGNSWVLIASYLPGRSRIDVKTRFRSIRRAAKRFMTKQDDELLIQLYHNYGGMWNDEIMKMFPSKTKSSVKLRLKELLTNQIDITMHTIGSPNQLLLSKPDIVYSILQVESSKNSNSASPSMSDSAVPSSLFNLLPKDGVYDQGYDGNNYNEIVDNIKSPAFDLKQNANQSLSTQMLSLNPSHYINLSTSIPSSSTGEEELTSCNNQARKRQRSQSCCIIQDAMTSAKQ